ncbi:MAG: MFS transporter, partial [Acidobacteriota bacterium]|nr:MFS transporter [Acidobacteriota bacterium]
KEFALSDTSLGKLFSAFFWTYALLQLCGAAGWLADRYRATVVLAWGVALWSAATLFTGVVSGFTLLFGARLLLGAGESVAYPCYSRIFASEIPAANRGLANALIDAGSKVGPALGTLFGGMLLEGVGWRMFFVALGLASLAWLAPFIRVVVQGQRAGAAAGAVPAPDEAGHSPGTIEILSKRSAWGAFFGHFCGNYFWYFLLTWLPTYLVRERGFGMQQMVRLTTISFFAIATATVIAGWASDRLIARGFTPTRVRKSVVVLGLSCTIVILPMATVRDSRIAVTLLLAACVSFGIYASNHWAITQTLSGPLAAGRWTSLQNGVGNLAGVAASWITGVVSDRTHSFALAFAVAGCVALTGAAMWGLVVGRIEQVEWTARERA